MFHCRGGGLKISQSGGAAPRHQSSVSRQVQQSERELGAVLFHRDRQYMQLTDNCRSVLSQAWLVMADAAALLAVVANWRVTLE